jgi:hypothetical protein
MSTMPPDQPGSTPPPPPPSGQPGTGGAGSGGGGPHTYGGLGRMPTTGAILPIPGNAEFLLYFVVVVFLIIVWAASDLVEARYFSLLLTILTSFYFVSRGIAKASRVLEQ